MRVFNIMNFQNPFHETYKQFTRQRKREEMKNHICKTFGVTLMRINNYDVENLEVYIRQKN